MAMGDLFWSHPSTVLRAAVLAGTRGCSKRACCAPPAGYGDPGRYSDATLTKAGPSDRSLVRHGSGQRRLREQASEGGNLEEDADEAGHPRNEDLRHAVHAHGRMAQARARSHEGHARGAQRVGPTCRLPPHTPEGGKQQSRRRAARALPAHGGSGSAHRRQPHLYVRQSFSRPDLPLASSLDGGPRPFHLLVDGLQELLNLPLLIHEPLIFRPLHDDPKALALIRSFPQ